MRRNSDVQYDTAVVQVFGFTNATQTTTATLVNDDSQQASPLRYTYGYTFPADPSEDDTVVLSASNPASNMLGEKP